MVMATGKFLGRLSCYAMAGRRRVTQINLALAFPEKTERQRILLTRDVFQHIGMAAAETAWIWHRWPETPWQVSIEGAEHIDNAIKAGKGVILLQAHFTVLELCGPIIGSRWSVSAVYDNPKNPLFAAYLFQQRSRYLTKLIDNNGIREMVRCLRKGEIVWYSPDQSVAAAHGGVCMQYFDQPALTTSGTARIVAMTGAVVIPFVPTRQQDGQRYTFTFKEPLKFDSEDPLFATQQVNDQLEADVRSQPEQYLWAHKRFKPPDSSYPNPYA